MYEAGVTRCSGWFSFFRDLVTTLVTTKINQTRFFFFDLNPYNKIQE